MTSTSLHLYVDSRFVSPFAMQAFVALHEKALAFGLSTLDLDGGAQRAPAYADRSLTGRVPTLVHDGFALSESSAIAEYLDEVFPGTPLYPRDPRQRARARQVQAWLRTDLMPIRQERSTEVVFYGPVAAPLSAQAREAADKLFFVAGRLLANGDEALFGQWSIVDLDLAIMLNRLVLNDDPVPPKLAGYARRQWQRPTVRGWVEMERPPR
ncbi:glutathione S-transferase [Pseudoxanthomonas broegbernensis]|uniref:Glutathione S-transferase n=1 Tax=Pseudoxanthomonas broegbernensis TaxID=83619 RepID=A0A7V8GQ19_9GAMM|nr:glutathione transferase [Pseudoxanthomonas broegbernensis]KAF1688090.1 glutathione S-transferase [Pseudoxanthomonas broegbernensis]MBB6065128.1 glutathione S-transferase [Pseudoxanthomonas broegbernensis]